MPSMPAIGAAGAPPLGRGLTRRWFFRHEATTSGSLVDRLLVARGVEPADRDAFLRGALTDVERPWERPDLVAAADALLEAIRAGRSIAVYGDYDVDGITSTAIIYHAARTLDPEARIRTYVPHRMDEGYGLNGDALRTLAAEGIEFVLTVDCGVTAVAEAELARELGLELVITDHHRPRDDGRLPQVRAIAHPSLPGREHRFTECCGAVVAWKVVWAMFDRMAGSPEGHRLPAKLRDALSSLLPLAAIGTVADVMPLVGENRAIVKHGLAGITRTGIEGIDALLTLGDVGRSVDSETVGFRLAPRLNAVGRLGSAEKAVQLLTTATGRDCAAIVRELDTLNDERRRTERSIFEHACQLARERGMDREGSKAIVLAHPDWHAGVVGIVCSRLVDVFGRPTILMQRLEDTCKGSGRSIHGFSLVDAIHGCGEMPLKSGGHDHAAGITLRNDRLDAFTEAFRAYASERLRAEDLVPGIEVDAIASLDELDLGSVLGCERLAPFGRGNPRPTILVEDVLVTAPPKLMGKDQQHLLIQLRQGDARWIKAKWWSGRPHVEHVRQGARLDLVVEPKVNRYLGEESVELEIRDARTRA